MLMVYQVDKSTVSANTHLGFHKLRCFEFEYIEVINIRSCQICWTDMKVTRIFLNTKIMGMMKSQQKIQQSFTFYHLPLMLNDFCGSFHCAGEMRQLNDKNKHACRKFICINTSIQFTQNLFNICFNIMNIRQYYISFLEFI